jgi:hypothetical protein
MSNLNAAAQHVARALQPLRESMLADGYDLAVEPGADRLLVRVEAQADACGDCLVPKAMFLALVQQMLKDAGSFEESVPMDVLYPAGSIHN